MFVDPQALTIAGTATSLPRVASSAPQRVGQFATGDGNFTLAVRQDGTNNRRRREVRLTQRKIAADPISTLNKEASASVIIAFDEPINGFSDVELTALFTALSAHLSAGTNANALRLLGGEL